MEQQSNLMEKGKMKKGKMEMPMTGGPSLGLLLLPAPALLVPIHRIAERDCLEIRRGLKLGLCKSVIRSQEALFWTLCTIYNHSREALWLFFRQSLSEAWFPGMSALGNRVNKDMLRSTIVVPTRREGVRKVLGYVHNSYI